jgi:nitric oxide reductase NorD protein
LEERVGSIYHRLITRAARTGYPEAAVCFEDIAASLGIVFRALGGDRAAGLKAGYGRPLGVRRNLLQKIAGTHKKHPVAWIDGDNLYLPECIASFPETALNRDCYLWLIALSAQCERPIGNWYRDNLQCSRRALHQYPGLRGRYRQLLAALPATREVAEKSGAAERRQEHRLLQSMWEVVQPVADGEFAATGVIPQWQRLAPVPLWLYPPPPVQDRPGQPDDGQQETFTSKSSAPRRKRTRKAEYVDHGKGNDGLIAFRLENLFTWSEFVNVNRTHDDEEDEDAENIADDLDVLSLARDRSLTASSALKFDLDLPAPDNDDLRLGDGIPLPEWDYKQQRLQPGYCCLQPLLDHRAAPCQLPARLHGTARQLRSQFEMLAPVRSWNRRQPDGDEIDLDAWLLHRADESLHKPAEQRLYKSFNASHRDMASLLLADLSFSTDAWVNNHCRVIDIIRDSLFLFSEALASVRDRFGLYGFSSRRRSHVRFNILKNFNEPYGDQVRGRIDAIRPGYYTRMGAPIRQATKILSGEDAAQRLLLILTDGKPNDLDRYEGRYGIEDTREAILEARRAGLHPFCITIDEEASDYLPYIFGSGGYVLIHNPLQLPRQLARLYLQLTYNR